MLLEVERMEGGEDRCLRRLVAMGRWPDTPAVLVCDHDTAGRSWRVVGYGESREAAAGVAWEARLLDVLPGEPPGAGYTDLERLIGSKKKWLAALNELVQDGRVIRAGGGVKGDPFRHWRAASDSVPRFHSEAGTKTSRGIHADAFRFHSLPAGEMESEASRDDGDPDFRTARPHVTRSERVGELAWQPATPAEEAEYDRLRRKFPELAA
jgi:hypothetical protein